MTLQRYAKKLKKSLHSEEYFTCRSIFRFLGPVIYKILGLRCTSFGYQYSEIVGSLSGVYFCGGDYVKDGTTI